MPYSVMVVEDEPLILKSIVRNINACDAGFEVISEALNGEEALASIKRKPPDVLFSDISMPRIDGLRVMEKIDMEYPYILKIIVSGFADFDYARKAIQYNAVGYLLKPVVRDEIMDTLIKCKVILDKKNAEAADGTSEQWQKVSINSAVALLKEYLKTHYMKDIDLDRIISGYYVNVDYLNRVFTKKIGISPSKYLTSLRINKAKQLLSTEMDLTIQEIGALSGYPNPAYFSRIFKSMTGYTPSQLKGGRDIKE